MAKIPATSCTGRILVKEKKERKKERKQKMIEQVSQCSKAIALNTSVMAH